MDYLDEIDFAEEESRSSWITAAIINGISTGMNFALVIGGIIYVVG
jgi:hypothetical protein